MSSKQEEPLLTSRQAAERLDVNLETLYKDVARELVRRGWLEHAIERHGMGEPSARARSVGPLAGER